MNKFQERLSIFEEMGRIDDMLYETDDFIGVKSKDGDPSVKINRRKELKNYDSFLDSEIDKARAEILENTNDLFFLSEVKTAKEFEFEETKLRKFKQQ